MSLIATIYGALLSSSGVGCYVGLDFAGALSYADDIAILAPTPTAMCQLLAICDLNTSEFDIVFNADRSKFVVMASNKRRALYNLMCDCYFFIGGKPLKNLWAISSVPLLEILRMYPVDAIAALAKQTIFFVFQSLRSHGEAQTIQILL
jgi:putative heme iron utilization protein